MRKSKSITKYHLGWQLVRVSCKDLDSHNAKIDRVVKYLNDNANVHDYERVVNYLEGLERGYRSKNSQACLDINAVIDGLKLDKSRYMAIEDSVNVNVTDVDLARLIALYKDLSRRSKGWAKGNYVHQEQAAFEDMLASVIERRGSSVKHGDKLLERSETLAKVQKEGVKHNFFF